MNRKLAKLWSADLRDPAHKQAKGALFDGKGHCCLGRLCVVLNEQFVRDTSTQRYFVEGTNNFEVLPGRVMDRAGIATDGGQFVPAYGRIDSLADGNDEGLTFPQIADLIDCFWEDL
jgi:hypothetical protein